MTTKPDTDIPGIEYASKAAIYIIFGAFVISKALPLLAPIAILLLAFHYYPNAVIIEQIITLMEIVGASILVAFVAAIVAGIVGFIAIRVGGDRIESLGDPDDHFK